MRVQVHAELFPNVRLLAVSEQSTRSATLTVAVTHPGTNAHNCCLISNSDLTTIFPLSYWYSTQFYSDRKKHTYSFSLPVTALWPDRADMHIGFKLMPSCQLWI